ncbi:MAG TPA: hypothetical protein VFB76_13065 [Candidatus Angelobacter sp.]|nr:hypothetical protein [Candidatus Angelobacter sp.]
MVKRNYFWFLVIAGILAMQPQAISQGTSANGSSQANQGAVQTGQQPSPAAGSTLSVVCIIDDPTASGQAHACASDSYTTDLGHHLKLRVDGLQKWLEEKNAPESLALFINGREIKDSHPISVNPEQSELGFKLDKTTGSETTWDELIVLQKNWSTRGIFRNVRASIGPAGGTQYPTNAAFRLIFLPLPWAVACLLFCLSTLAGLVVLGRRSSVLKDSPGGPFSLARTQMAVWTWLTVSSYFFLFVMWWDTQVPIPTSILGLLGISASTYMAAALVDRTGSNTPPAVSKGFLKDICGGDQGVQLHRIQIIAWTVVLAFAYVMNILTKLSIPDFNPTLLGLLGLSAGTYVGFKFPENQAPVSTQTQPAAPVPPVPPVSAAAAAAAGTSGGVVNLNPAGQAGQR